MYVLSCIFKRESFSFVVCFFFTLDKWCNGTKRRYLQRPYQDWNTYRVKNKMKAVTTGSGGEFQREGIGHLFKKYVNLNNRKILAKCLKAFSSHTFRRRPGDLSQHLRYLAGFTVNCWVSSKLSWYESASQMTHRQTGNLRSASSTHHASVCTYLAFSRKRQHDFIPGCVNNMVTVVRGGGGYIV